ncbi:MAG: hypothetical protein IPK63_16455 [Candidatus Competibacteraceae bacterium]|nr:hypothetical protein [Candidatus Competibacteraceae bacterium]
MPDFEHSPRIGTDSLKPAALRRERTQRCHWQIPIPFSGAGGPALREQNDAREYSACGAPARINPGNDLRPDGRELLSGKVTPGQIRCLPGRVCGLNVACRAAGESGDAVLAQTPVYPPFLTAPLPSRPAIADRRVVRQREPATSTCITARRRGARRDHHLF